MFLRPAHSNCSYCRLILATILSFGSTCFVGIALGTFAISPALAEQLSLEKLTDPAYIERVISTSGMQFPNLRDAIAVMESNKDGTFRVTIRLSGGETKDCKEYQLKNGKTSVCEIPNWKPPEGFVSKAAVPSLSLNDFWTDLRSPGYEFPEIGGAGDVENPIEVRAFIINPEVNEEINATWGEVLRVCADPSGRSKKALDGYKRKDCRDAKSELNVVTEKRIGAEQIFRAELEGEQQIAKAKAEGKQQIAKAKAEGKQQINEMNTELNREQRLNQVLKRWVK